VADAARQHSDANLAGPGRQQLQALQLHRNAGLTQHRGRYLERVLVSAHETMVSLLEIDARSTQSGGILLATMASRSTVSDPSLQGQAESPGTENDYSIRAAERVCEILALLGDHPEGVLLIDVARRIGLPKSSAFRYMVTLEAKRFVQRDPATAKFRLGPAVTPLQVGDAERLEARARPHLVGLRDRFGETVNLAQLDGTRVRYLAVVESAQPVRVAARRGDREFVHSTALGKAIAACLDEPQVDAILAAEGMPARTEKTITTPEALHEDLASVRQAGYALDDGENEANGRCVAVALPGARVPTALGLSAPEGRLPMAMVPEVHRALREAAERVVANDA
jgi:IclR family acetate operon transcriptional repressor